MKSLAFRIAHDVLSIVSEINNATQTRFYLKEAAQYIWYQLYNKAKEEIGTPGNLLTGNRKGFLEELDEWVDSRPREKAPE